MYIETNEKLIRRNSRIAQIAGIIGMAVLAGGIFILLRFPEQIILVWGTVLVGFILSQLAIYLTNRYGRKPRADESINAALKGLDDNYTLYHYLTPTSHLLVGPGGIWAIVPKFQKGEITFQRGRYRTKKAGFVQNYMKLFGQEGLGRPDLEASTERESIERFLKKRLPEVEPPSVQSAVVFTNDDAILSDMDEAPVPTVPVKKFKELVRKNAKSKPLSMEKVNLVNDCLQK